MSSATYTTDMVAVFVAHAVSIGMPLPIAKAITPSESALGSPADILHIHLDTPLLPYIFAQFLHKHPDKAFISKLIQSLKYGFNIGYLDPHTPHIANNLQSALKHCKAIDEALQKEVGQTEWLVPINPHRIIPYNALVLE